MDEDFRENLGLVFTAAVMIEARDLPLEWQLLTGALAMIVYQLVIWKG